MKTLDLHEAAAFLRMHPETLRRRALAREIPSARPGKAWVFIDDDLAGWLRGQYDQPARGPNQRNRIMLYRRPNSRCWWTRFTTPDGKEIRRSTGTEDKKSAEEYEACLKRDLWRIARLGERPRRSWPEAVVRWIEETAHKASHADDLCHLRWLDPHLKESMLDDIDRDRLDALLRIRKAAGVSNATVNRTAMLIRAILRRAEREWGWLERAPAVRMLPEPKQRIRWLTHDEADRLLAELPEHLADMARFSLATGLREANVTGLRWDQVDLERRVAWIHPDEAKARRAIGVPLNSDAVLVLRRWQGRHPDRVFVYKGAPIAKAGTLAWKKALARAGIAGFRWHDLRHTWASWHVQSGTPLHVLQELGGWPPVSGCMSSSPC